jgi:hypothetical protein
MLIKNFFLLFFVSMIGSIGMAQPFTLDKKVKPVLLNLIPYKAKDSAYNGKINITNVNQIVDTSYYYVKGLGIYQPVIFKIVSSDKKSKIKIQLAKDNWKKPDHTATLKPDGTWETVFRTEGSFGIQIINPDKKATYQLMVWVGNEPKKMKMPSPFKEETITKPKTVAKPAVKKSVTPKKKNK